MATQQRPGVERQRRMASAERRRQLGQAALEVAARHGYAGLSLDDVAERAGVTRNLLYHYFPRGRFDVFLAAADLAGEALTEGWITDERVPLDQKLAANFERMIDHAAEPSDAWRVYRHSRIPAEPEIQEVAESYRQVMIASIALNHFGTADPPPLAKLGLRAFLAYAEQALDTWREEGLDRAAVQALLARTLVATMDAAREIA
ncbi:MAG: TetR/AcrR family transcriptional regulator [Solirubrobacterales bacterium]